MKIPISTRLVQFEGGPRDGEYAIIEASQHEIYVLIREFKSMLNPPSPLILPRRCRIGAYRQDPLDPFTMNWIGEV